MCLYPKLIPNPKYKANKKSGGNIPPVIDDLVKLVPIGCQECIECRKQKAREWQVRLHEDIKTHRNGKFITLTFNTESLQKLAFEVNHIKEDEGVYTERKNKLSGYELDNAIAVLAMRRFLEL